MAMKLCVQIKVVGSGHVVPANHGPLYRDQAAYALYKQTNC